MSDFRLKCFWGTLALSNPSVEGTFFCDECSTIGGQLVYETVLELLVGAW